MNGILSFFLGIPLITAALTGVGFLDVGPAAQPVFESVEVGIAELSPAGEAGGYAIPASANSCPEGWANGGCNFNHGGQGPAGEPGGTPHCAQRTCTPPPPPNVSCTLKVSPSQVTETYSGSITLERNGSPNNATFGTLTYLNGNQIGGTSDFNAPADATFNVVNAFGSVARPTTVGTHTYKQDVRGELYQVASGWESCSDTLTVTTAKNLAARNNPTVSGTLLEGDTVTISGSSIENTSSVNITKSFQNRYQIDVNNDGVINTGDGDITRATGKITLNKNTTVSAGSVTVGGLEAGTYKVRFMVDTEDDIDETSESEANNTTGWKTFTISTPPPPPEPDLYPTKDPNAPANVEAGDQITFTGGRVKNGGDTNTPSNFNNRYEVAVNGNKSNPETLNTGSISLNAGAFQDVTANSTWTAVAGNHEVRLVTDFNDSVTEADEGNNTSDWIPFTVGAAASDKNLIARDKPFVSGDLTEGGQVVFSDASLENNGSENITTNFNNRYEIDMDGDGVINPTTEGGNDITRSTGLITLNSGQTAIVGSDSWNNPEAGTYQVRLYVDFKDTVAETNESEANNTTGWTVFTISEPPPPPEPDLKTTKDPAVPTGVEEGTQITFTGGRVKNGGAANASSFNNRYELALNGNKGNTTKFTTGNISLNAGAFQDVTANNTWTAVAGNHEVRLVTDFNDSVTEADEGNNISDWVPFTIVSDEPPLPPTSGPNLGISSSPDKPTNVTEGDTITFTGGAIQNFGDEDTSGNFNNRYEIALNKDENDINTRSTGLISLDAGESETVTASNSWNAVIGTHKVRLVADYNDNIDESNENDNTSGWVTFTVDSDEPPPPPSAPDLRPVKAPTAPSGVYEGEQVTFTGGQITNEGSEGTGNFNNQYEIALHSNESNLNTRSTGVISLSAGASQNVTANNSWNAVAGTHKVRLVADFNNSVSESDESDNASAWKTFTILTVAQTECSDGVDNADPEDSLVDLADPGCNDSDDDDETDPVVTQANLTVSGANVSGVLEEGETLNLINGSVTNSGTANVTNNFNNRYEIDLNRDGTVDVTRATGLISSLPVGATSYAGTETWNASAGNHRIRYVADFNDSVGETNESDNASSWTNFTITDSEEPPIPPATNPDLRPTQAPTAPSGVYEGEQITFVGGQITNEGDADTATTFNNRYEIALNQNEGDLSTRSTGLISLSIGSSQNVTASNSWNAVAGTHKVRLVADFNDSISESDETDNASAWKTFTVLSTAQPECSDSVDNADPEDSLVDLADPGCNDTNDDDETDPVATQADLTVSTADVSGTLEAGETLNLIDGSVTNSGTANVTNNFNNQYQIDLGRDGTIDVTRATGLISSLPVGATSYAGTETWNASAGDHRIRYVADFNDSVGETDENNNASSWTDFTVSGTPEDPPVNPPVVDLTANGGQGPVDVLPDEIFRLEWEVVAGEADSCAGFGHDDLTNPDPAGGFIDISESTGSNEYTVQCNNSGGVDSDSVTVNVISGADPTIDADPDRVPKGDTTTLNWDPSGNPSCTVDGNGENFVIDSAGSKTTAPINNEVVYTIDCEGPTDSVTVRVTATFEEI